MKSTGTKLYQECSQHGEKTSRWDLIKQRDHLDVYADIIVSAVQLSQHLHSLRLEPKPVPSYLYDGKLMQDMTYGISYHIQYATNTIITKIHLYGPHHTACQDPVVKELKVTTFSLDRGCVMNLL